MPSRELEHLRDAFHDMVDKLRVARESIARQVEEERHMRQELESLQQVIRQERLAAIGVLVSASRTNLTIRCRRFPDSPNCCRKSRARGQGRSRSDSQESNRAGAIIRNLSRFTGSGIHARARAFWKSCLGDRAVPAPAHRSEHPPERDEQATQPAHAVFTERSRSR